jgi:hypothetical protein
MKVNVIDCKFSELTDIKHNISFFAEGYDERCTFVPKSIFNHSSNSFVMHFKEEAGHSQRKINQSFFRKLQAESIYLSSSDDKPFYDILNSYKHMDNISVLIDYSSMSRRWYSSIITWFYLHKINCVLDFTYTVGNYRHTVEPLIISDIVSISCCSGSISSTKPKVAIFGLGFDPISTRCVLEMIEPDIVHAFFASPGAFKSYSKRALKVNKDLIDNICESTIKIPLHSVELTVVYLNEIISPYIGSHDIMIIPMGPKPHVLASILSSLQNLNVSCLHVRGSSKNPMSIKAVNVVVSTRVSLTF